MTPLRHTAAHVVVDDLEHPVLDDADAHHLGKVLRVRVGEDVSVTDGRGRWRVCRMGEGRRLVDAGPIGTSARERRVAVAFALTKGDKPEVVVQKLTELGVDLVVPFVAERSVVRWDEAKAERNVDRWRRIAREAVMQSRQVFVPTVLDVQPSLAAAVSACGGTVAVAEPGGPPFDAHVTAVVVGPEGGFAPHEITGPTVSLPGGVLRAETAAVVAGTLLVAARSDHSE